MARYAAAAAGGLLAGALTLCAAARAESFEACVSVDGLITLEGGALYVENPDTRERAALEHTIAHSTLLREIEGYCESDAAPGQRFPFWRRATAIAATAELDGRPVDIDMLCESLGDGLPAGLTCDRERITTARGAHVD